MTVGVVSTLVRYDSTLVLYDSSTHTISYGLWHFKDTWCTVNWSIRS